MIAVMSSAESLGGQKNELCVTASSLAKDVGYIKLYPD